MTVLDGIMAFHCDITAWWLSEPLSKALNTLRPRQNGRHLADDIFKRIYLNENVGIPIKISLKFVPQGPINNIQPLVQIMAWRRPGDKPLSEPVLVRLPTHICVTRPQWVKSYERMGCSCISRYNIQQLNVKYISSYELWSLSLLLHLYFLICGLC